jgi:hypothetical protein
MHSAGDITGAETGMCEIPGELRRPHGANVVIVIRDDASRFLPLATAFFAGFQNGRDCGATAKGCGASHLQKPHPGHRRVARLLVRGAV